MDARQIKKAKRQRFADVLEAFCRRHNLKDSELAVMLGKPRSTVTHWRLADRSPPATELPSICAKLNINYRLLFTDHMVRGLFYETQVLSFEALQLRYMDVRSEDAMRAFDFITIAGAIVFNRLTREAIECTLKVHNDYSVRIHFLTSGLKDFVLTVSPSGEKGIGLTLLNLNIAVTSKLPWTYLSQSSMDSFVGLLHSEDRA